MRRPSFMITSIRTKETILCKKQIISPVKKKNCHEGIFHFRGSSVFVGIKTFSSREMIHNHRAESEEHCVLQAVAQHEQHEVDVFVLFHFADAAEQKAAERRSPM